MPLNPQQLASLVEKIVDIYPFIFAASQDPLFENWLVRKPYHLLIIKTFSDSTKELLEDELQHEGFRELISKEPPNNTEVAQARLKQKWIAFLNENPPVVDHFMAHVDDLLPLSQEWDSYEALMRGDSGNGSVATPAPVAGPGGRAAAAVPRLIGARHRPRSVAIEDESSLRGGGGLSRDVASSPRAVP